MQNPFEILEDKLNHLLRIMEDMNSRIGNQQFVDSKPMNITEAARYLDIAKPTLYALTSKREIPHIKRGKRLYFNKTELDAWLQTHRKKTVAEIEKEI